MTLVLTTVLCRPATAAEAFVFEGTQTEWIPTAPGYNPHRNCSDLQLYGLEMSMWRKSWLIDPFAPPGSRGGSRRGRGTKVRRTAADPGVVEVATLGRGRNDEGGAGVGRHWESHGVVVCADIQGFAGRAASVVSN